MGWNSVIFPLLIITPSGGFTGLFLYSPAVGPGNLIGSWTAKAGVDPYGNAYPAGINVTSGVLSGVQINATTETLNPGPLFVDAPAGQVITTFTAPGVNNWVAPAGITSVAAYVWGAGGGGDGGDPGGGESGGGGGAFSFLGTVAVTPTNTYHATVGAGGAANTAGGNSSFAGDVVTVTGNGGGGAADPTPGAGGVASTLPAGVTSYAGGGGGHGADLPAHGGGGGGGGAGTNGPGSTGGDVSGGTGGAGGAGGAGFLFLSGAGGAGGNSGANGNPGVLPGGGGGGAGTGGATAGGAGAGGKVILIYSPGILHTIAAIAGSAVTDPVTGYVAQPGITTVDSVFGTATRINGALVTIGSSPVWQLSSASFDVVTIGQGLQVAEGANAKQGSAGPLVAGTLTVANTSVTATSRIHVTGSPGGANRGGLNVTAQVAGTSFTVTSTNAADTGNFVYEIFEPG